MSINLGLERVASILHALKAPQKSFQVFHVAGTNGKGSVCAYLSSILHRSSLTTGRFTSPHFIHPRYSISINEKPVSRLLFDDAHRMVQSISQREAIDATSFELLTATALEIFYRKGIDVAVVEVGLGGRFDATNVDYKVGGVLGSIITRIGLDHQNFLGDTIGDITHQKTGIMRRNVPVTVYGDNEDAACKVILQDAAATKCPVTIVSPSLLRREVDERGMESLYLPTKSFGDINLSASPLNGSYQHMNLACAITALDLARPSLPTVTRSSIREGITRTKWPGRLQVLNASEFSGDDTQQLVLLDGAHNVQAATCLNEYVEDLRKESGTITWVMALSGNRDCKEIMSLLLRNSDRFYPASFGAVDGMPWVRPLERNELTRAAIDLLGSEELVFLVHGAAKDIIKDACKHNSPVVVCGSLYLVSDVLADLCGEYF
ncbi:Mur ligase [Lipomyces tetrasporus]|uniref:Dihydrofolate synthetase n=1 Tax=Lipomyces tetrasporus TaxID=54092 RepID=A0AAD7VU90_9ASCO|nr:Mur ligase [Lipomyces tetrasporus]KAJ8102877.1 Mur ligase [Lipomyces tetrasporus]